MSGVRRARTKKELNIAKKIPPSGEAKKSATSMADPIVGRIDLISSRGPLGPPPPDGGSW